MLSEINTTHNLSGKKKKRGDIFKPSHQYTSIESNSVINTIRFSALCKSKGIFIEAKKGKVNMYKHGKPCNSFRLI